MVYISKSIQINFVIYFLFHFYIKMSSSSNKKRSSPTISGSSNSDDYTEPLNDDKLLLKDIYTFVEDQNAS